LAASRHATSRFALTAATSYLLATAGKSLARPTAAARARRRLVISGLALVLPLTP